jgi:hypothetical protein
MEGSPTAENACGTSAERLGRSTPGSWDSVGTFKCDENFVNQPWKQRVYLYHKMMTCPFRVNFLVEDSAFLTGFAVRCRAEHSYVNHLSYM